MIRYLFCSGNKIKIGKDDYSLPKKGELLWLLVSQPKEEEIKKLARDFSLNPKIVKSYHLIKYSQRLSLEPLQFVFVDYFFEKGKTVKTRNFFVLEKNFMIIFSETSYYQNLFDQISKEIKNEPSKARISYLLCRIIEEDITENYGIIDNLEKKIDLLIHDLCGVKDVPSQEIVILKKESFQIGKNLNSTMKTIFIIKNSFLPFFHKEDQLILEDVYHTLQHQTEILSNLKEILTDALEIYVSNISNRINGVMKTLTALTVIIALPTLMASIYGMNFGFIPLAEPFYGFWLITGGILILALLLCLLFYKLKWLQPREFFR